MLQLALTIWGIVILAKRRVKMSKNKVVTGGPAIAIGTIFVSLLPLGFIIGFCLGILLSAQGVPMETLQGYGLFADFGLLILAVIAAFMIAAAYGRPENEPAVPSHGQGTVMQQPPADSGNPYARPVDSGNPYNPPGGSS